MIALPLLRVALLHKSAGLTAPGAPVAPPGAAATAIGNVATDVAQQTVGQSPEGWGMGIGAVLGGLGGALMPEDTKYGKKRGRLKHILMGGSLGALGGLGVGAAYKNWLDPGTFSPEERRALLGYKNVDKDAWKSFYERSAKDPAALEAYKKFPDDPNHPVNRIHEALQEHARNPKITEGTYSDLPRSPFPIDSSRPDDAPYVSKGPGPDGKWATGGGFTTRDLRDLGFVDSAVAVPEAQQAKWMTYRHPDVNAHWHRHDKNWFFHNDTFPSVQMLQARLKREGLSPTSPKQLARAAVYGAPHAVMEGVPGWAGAVKSWLTDEGGLDQIQDRQDGVPSNVAGKFNRPEVIAKRVGLTAGIPLAGYGVYKGVEALDEHLDEASKKKRRGSAAMNQLRRLLEKHPELRQELA